MSTATATGPDSIATTTVPHPGTRRWLLFVHQLPASPSNLRVRTWRRLQQLGAVPVKHAVYALPDTPATREDFEWLKAEVTSAGGDASVFAADHIDTYADDALVDEFRRARQVAFGALAGEIEQVLARVNATRHPRGTRAPAIPRLVEAFRVRLAALERIDFFGSPGRDRAASLVARLEERTRPSPHASGSAAAVGAADITSYTRRSWVTRPRPGVDRMGSAWLIRRFIDAEARFAFAVDRESLPAADAIPFDIFGVEFSHQGEGCTFETLCTVFRITDPAVARIAEIVHDLDLKDGRFGAPDAGTVGTLIEGLQLTTAEDDLLLERGITLFESLYRAFAKSARDSGPRPVTKPRARAPAASAMRRPASGSRRR
jgi:hypothetical protein